MEGEDTGEDIGRLLYPVSAPGELLQEVQSGSPSYLDYGKENEQT
jgi:hypothetical protein